MRKMRKGGPTFAEWLGLALLRYAHTGKHTWNWKEVILAIAVGINTLLLKNS